MERMSSFGANVRDSDIFNNITGGQVITLMFTLICEERVESYPIPTFVCDHTSLTSEASGIVNNPGACRVSE